MLYSNACCYDCGYCVNRLSNDVPRATFTPRELAELTIGFYKRNYIEGLFLSSAVIGTPDYTMERICYYLQKRAKQKLQIDCIMYANEFGELAKSRGAEQWFTLLEQEQEQQI